MSLHVDSHGSGAPLVMLHGWGMHGGIWGDAVQRLARHFRVHCVNMPGHGRSTGKGEEGREKGNGGAEVFPFPLPSIPFSLDAIVSELSAQFDGPLNVCGWSLGGQIALRWAQLAPEQVRRLVLISTTPRFVQTEDWECAIAADTLQEFFAALAESHALTLRRFIALQVRGSANERELLADLRARLFSRGEPDVNALRAGLEILRDADLRAELPSIRQPALVIAGERDKLTPPQASYYLAQTLPDARMVEIAGAAHTPFLSHPEIVVERMTDFLYE